MANELMEKPIEYVSATGEQVKLTMSMVRTYLVSGNANLVTDQEIVYFINICRARKLNPFTKDCYLIKYDSSPAAIITSVDYFRKNAIKSPDCRGWKKGVVVVNKDGEMRYSNGIVMDNEKIIGGWFRAKPKGWDEPFELEVNLAGYIKKKRDGTPTQFWEPEKQSTMIAKVAEAQGLKTLWGEAATGMHVAEEIVEDIDLHPGATGTYSRQPPAETAEKPKEPTAPTQADTVKEFDILMGKAATSPLMEKFLNASALHFSMSVDAIKKIACEDPEKFITQFYDWEKRYSVKEQQAEPSPGPDTDATDKAPDFRDEWIRLRAAGYSTYVYRNIEKFKNCELLLAAEARNKWQNFYDEPWPLDPDPDTAKNPPQAPPVDAGEDIFNDEGQSAHQPDPAPPEANGISKLDFNGLIQTEEWLAMSLLQEKHPKIYAAVTGGKMPKTLSEVVAVTDEITARVTSTDDDIPSA